MEDEETPGIVVDLGSRYCRAGFSGDEAPRCEIENVIGVPKHKAGSNDVIRADTFVGDEAQRRRGVLSLRYPVQRGIVTDWDAMETIWNHVFFSELSTDPKDVCVLVSEAPLNPKGNRERMAQIMFEKFNTPGFYCSLDSLLTLYGAGRGRGVVITCGEGVTHVLPLYESHLIQHAVGRVDFAGSDLTFYLSQMLEERGYNFSTTPSLEIVRTMKERLCYCAEEYELEVDSCKAELTPEATFELPDGHVITLGKERFQVPEGLFNPSLLGRNECPGLSQLVSECFRGLERDVHGDLLCNIVLSGGSTMFPGFQKRLLKELSVLFPSRNRVCVVAYPERKFLTWIGGSILASLSTFQSCWITKADYEENGPDIVHTKCF